MILKNSDQLKEIENDAKNTCSDNLLDFKTIEAVNTMDGFNNINNNEGDGNNLD